MTPSRSELVRVFGRIGLLSFGGPAAQIALMHRELVETRLWLDETTFLRALSLCMLLPGPEAMQLATYAGWRLRGVPGGLISGGLFVLPGALVISALVALYVLFGDLPLAHAGFLGIKAAVIAIVVQALRKLSSKTLTNRSAWVIAGLSFIAIFAFALPFPLIVCAAGFWGYLCAKPADAPLPRSKWQYPAPGTMIPWLVLWLTPIFGLHFLGPTLLADLGWLFVKLAVVTFGGAYAVLAYMTQTVVEHHQWISTTQMIDALGLAETTPGPLILVTQFVAMLAGYMAGGPAMALAAGVVALWATFIPCFLWIFSTAPILDQVAGRPRLAAALKAITSAVVGVILNLSLWFGMHVLFGEVAFLSLGPVAFWSPVWASFDLLAASLSAFAATLVFVLNLGIGVTLALMIAAGMASYFF
ncbi:chromate efflux transporter [Ruegeria sp. WL0004]|uniref:Chromate efflux transporter n=1 Tax=Ruegeria marisflavi TaxID=2984152 RepID=A0ABT2WV92_9RHOB|nr:chromate efflux transporter [Ruegeria sp. WL0004]MCU9839806.1 chromate efflux transporter [Ruegeria sp. WL0004]